MKTKYLLLKLLLVMVLLVIIAIGCSPAPEPKQHMTEFQVKNLVWSLTSEYDAGIPDIFFDQNKLTFKTTSLAETVCNYKLNSCYVVFQPCALYNRNIEELAIHEAGHVIVAIHEKRFDHGPEWKQFMKDNGYPFPEAKLLHNSKCK